MASTTQSYEPTSTEIFLLFAQVKQRSTWSTYQKKKRESPMLWNLQTKQLISKLKQKFEEEKKSRKRPLETETDSLEVKKAKMDQPTTISPAITSQLQWKPTTPEATQETCPSEPSAEDSSNFETNLMEDMLLEPCNNTYGTLMDDDEFYDDLGFLFED